MIKLAFMVIIYKVDLKVVIWKKLKRLKGKGKHFINNSNKLVYVYPAEIFCPAVPVIKDGLYMTVQEYQFLCDSI